MKICWDNLEKLEFKNNTFYKRERDNSYTIYIYRDKCKKCGDPFLFQKYSIGNFCCLECRNKYKKGENHYWFDKKLSEEHKEKIRRTLKGRENPQLSKLNKTRTGDKNPNFGNKWSDKQKKEMSLKKMGMLSGDKNPNWKGGISCEPYCDVWLDKDFKESIKERDGYQCLNPACSRKSGRICVHHINYIKKDCNPFNLITLCNSCNSRANVDREWHENWYSIIIQKRYQRSNK